MADETDYIMSQADDDRERSRLRQIETATDEFTVGHLAATGVGDGWHCLEVGAGTGSIAMWLGERVHPTGSVLATDLDVNRLAALPDNIEVRRHDITCDAIESEAYDLVHCRFVLQHVPDPGAALQRMADAVVPGGWIVIEEGDFGLAEFSGAPESTRASRLAHDLFTRWRAAGVIDAYLGRRLPELVASLAFAHFSFDVFTATGGPGDPAYETVRQAWPDTRAGAAATGFVEDDLICLDKAFDNSTFIVGNTTFAAWGQKPR